MSYPWWQAPRLADADARGRCRVLVIGAGGLGTPAILSLADAGVGTIGVLDPDRVEPSNLHRQILYRPEDVGTPKVHALARALAARFPRLRVEAEAEAFRAENHDVVTRYDLVLDGTDRFESKLAVADAAGDRGVPYVFAGVVGYDAQVLGVRPGASACLRCFFDDAPPPGAAATCADLGILGPIAGIAGAVQAEVALAMLLGAAGVLDRLWVYDGRRDRERTVELRRAADCRGCGTRRALRGAAIELATSPDEVVAPVLDLSGAVCPATYLATRRALEPLAVGARLWVHLSSDESARNVPASAAAAGHRVLSSRSDGNVHRVLIERGPSHGQPTRSTPPQGGREEV